MITVEKLKEQEPNIQNALAFCKEYFPDFGNLTIPMQGMVAGSCLTEKVEYEDIWLDEKEGARTEIHTKVIWNFPANMLDSSNSFRILTDYRATLAYAKTLFEMHLNWGLEK